MQSDEETKELLREIRDEIVKNSEKYDKVTARYDNATEKYEMYLSDYQRTSLKAQKGVFEQWSFVAVMLFATGCINGGALHDS